MPNRQTVPHNHVANSPADSQSFGSSGDSRFQCAIIDAEGHEVPITEQMIQRALQAFIPAPASLN